MGNEFCCSNEDSTGYQMPVDPSHPIIYGDYFNADTCALIAMCNLADTQYTFHKVDQMAGEHLRKEFISIAGSPDVTSLLMMGESRVNGGGGFLIFDFLMKSNDKVKMVFYHPAQLLAQIQI